MKSSCVRLVAASVLALVMAGCGGGDDSGANAPAPAPDSVKSRIEAAAADAGNDTSTNPSAALAVPQSAGVPAVVAGKPTKVNFTVFSGRSVVKTLTLANVSFVIAKLVPGVNGDIDQWVNYVYRTETPAAGVGPGGVPALPNAKQATTDPKPAGMAATQLVYNDDGYYTYTFSTDITDPAKTNGVVFEPNRTHRVAIQLNYLDGAGKQVLVNPSFDFSFDADGDAIPLVDPLQTRKMVDVGSCNGCHSKLSAHGGGRVDTQYCVTCHNARTTDANSGHQVTFMTMVHKIHAGRFLKASAGGETFTIWGFNNTPFDFSHVGFPQDLRNCSTCHSGANPATPQGDNWKTRISKEACLSCHASGVGSKWETRHKPIAETRVGVGSAATALPNSQCLTCHTPTSQIGSERVHWAQNQQDTARYRMNVESLSYDGASRLVTVKYFLSDPTNGNAAYDLVTPDCTFAAPNICATAGLHGLTSYTRFGNLQFRVAYQNIVGQPTASTEFTNGGAASAFAHAGVNDGSNHYTVQIAIPPDTATAVAAGTARLVSVGQVIDAKISPKTRAVDTVTPGVMNVGVQHVSQEFAISGPLNPRRTIVATEKCNVCHGSLGTTSGSNTLANAFHAGARNTVEACVTCHDANRMSTTVMTNGLAMQESYQFKRMIHGIHGNGKRLYPFTSGNRVKGQFDDLGALLADGTFLSNYSVTIAGAPKVVVAAGTVVPAGSTFATITDLINTQATAEGYVGAPIEAPINFAERAPWPGMATGLNARNCTACHIDDSYKVDRGTVGAVVSKPPGETDPRNWGVISPKAASCTSCHDSSAAIAHVTSWGFGSFGNETQAQGGWGSKEICADCHSPGGFKAVDVVHGLQ
jgi:OmcA/MtrC family decaheme c-type cytochrome